MPKQATLEAVQKSKEDSPGIKSTGLVTPVKSTKVVGQFKVELKDNNKSM